MATLKRNSETYNKCIAHVRSQYKDVVSLTEIHLNKQGKMYSAEWLDSKGVINMIGGYLLDLHKTIRVID